MLAKFIDEGKREHKEMEIFIKEFRTTIMLLLKTRSNLLSELKIKVNELLKVVSNVLILKNEVKGVTTRGGKMTSEATSSKEINETGINKNEPPIFKQDVQDKPHDDEQTKKWHDSRLHGDKDFKVGDQVLLYNSLLKMYPRKLKSKWSSPDIIKVVYPHEAIEITDKDVFRFKVNGQRLKKYYGVNIDKDDDKVIEFENGAT
nr:hypothetical protein [Tanacetum cinerariifolium]